MHNKKLSGPRKMSKAIFPGFSPSQVKLKNTNAERRWSRILAFGNCEWVKQAFTNWPKLKVLLKGQDNKLKLPPTNSKWDHLAMEIVTHKHDKISHGETDPLLSWHTVYLCNDTVYFLLRYNGLCKQMNVFFSFLSLVHIAQHRIAALASFLI